MICIVLAGGIGSRLSPDKPVAKPLVVVRGRPILDYVLDRVVESGMVRDIVVAVSPEFEQAYSEWVSGRHRDRVSVEVLPRSPGKDAGCIGCVARVVRMGGMEDDLLVVGGATLFTQPLRPFLEFFAWRKAACVAVYDLGRLPPPMRFSEVTLDAEGRISTLREKRRRPRSPLVTPCIYAFPAATLQSFRQYLEAGGRPETMGWFMEWYVGGAPVFGFMFGGRWEAIVDLESVRSARMIDWNG